MGHAEEEEGGMSNGKWIGCAIGWAIGTFIWQAGKLLLSHSPDWGYAARSSCEILCFVVLNILLNKVWAPE